MAASDGQADLIFTGGKVRSPAHPSGFVQALAVRGGLIQAVGTDEEIRQVTGPGTRVVPLRGRWPCPRSATRTCTRWPVVWRACAATCWACVPGRTAWPRWPPTVPG